MAKKIKYAKLLLVLFLTVLIWVWADRAKTESFTITTALVKANEFTPNLWISVGSKLSIPLEKVVLTGSTSKVDQAERDRREGKLDFVFLVDPDNLPELKRAGKHSINTAQLIRQSPQIKQLALTVQSCEPGTIEVQVTGLEQKELNVECVDEYGVVISDARITPPTVTVPAPNDWTAQLRIKLSAEEINQARSSTIFKMPFIELGDGQKRQGGSRVGIRLSSAEKTLPEHKLDRIKICYGYGPNLQGKYEVELLNPLDFTTLTIRATAVAKQVYEQQPYQILLNILDEDEVNLGEEKQRKVIYLFPEQYVRSNEIQLKDKPVDAKFKLVPKSNN